MPLGTTKLGLGPGDTVIDGDLARPTESGTAAPPLTFRPMSIVAKRSPISATALVYTPFCLSFERFMPTYFSIIRPLMVIIGLAGRHIRSAHVHRFYSRQICTWLAVLFCISHTRIETK